MFQSLVSVLQGLGCSSSKLNVKWGEEDLYEDLYSAWSVKSLRAFKLTEKLKDAIVLYALIQRFTVCKANAQ